MAMGEVENVIKGSNPKRKRNRADEMEREKRCRRGVAAVLSALGYKPQDQDDDFLETLGSKSKKMIKKKPKNRTRAKMLSKDKKMIISWKENKGKAVSIMLKEKPCDHGWQQNQIDINVDQIHQREGGSCAPNTSTSTSVDHTEKGLCSDHLMRFVNGVQGSNLKLVIEKELTATDVARHQGRLLLPFKQVKTWVDEFLTEEEFRLLDQGQQEMGVCFFDPAMRRVEGMKLKLWKMDQCKGLVLRTKWNQVVEENGLVPEMHTQLWSFRIGNSLCFVLLILS